MHTPSTRRSKSLAKLLAATLRARERRTRTVAAEAARSDAAFTAARDGAAHAVQLAATRRLSYIAAQSRRRQLGRVRAWALTMYWASSPGSPADARRKAVASLTRREARYRAAGPIEREAIDADRKEALEMLDRCVRGWVVRLKTDDRSPAAPVSASAAS